ncbi:MAG: hypothetical protein SWH68_11875 [Thermodesulfobacteriota bacterium]|nr:hypothetical protein [Thermodesulfobacteriota bacterium]
MPGKTGIYSMHRTLNGSDKSARLKAGALTLIETGKKFKIRRQCISRNDPLGQTYVSARLSGENAGSPLHRARHDERCSATQILDFQGTRFEIGIGIEIDKLDSIAKPWRTFLPAKTPRRGWKLFTKPSTMKNIKNMKLSS